MAIYKTKGIILKQRDLSETDKLLTIYTADFGKVQVKARGVRKTTSKLASHILPFTSSQLMLAQGKNLLTLADSFTINNFYSIRQDLEKTFLAYYIIELMDKFTSFGQSEIIIFDLTEKILSLIDWAPRTLYSTIIIFYQFSLLNFLGYQPQLKDCIHCQKAIEPNKDFFSPKLGGLLCPECSQYDPKRLGISPEAIKVLRIYSRERFDLVKKLKVNKKTTKEVFEILKHFSQYILSAELKSAKFLEKCLF